ncbi:MAG TPA: serine hydrolase domain-containing protein [Sphingomonas sp.]|jgi:CubicO group peptidase (beta-lactamase class C family)|nr:serine hydrolase domain-containing protein [Sphingomonas sp.]
MFRFLAALILALPASAFAQAFTPAQTAQIDALVAKALADTGVPSASIAVVRNGRIVLAKAYGRQSDAMPVARADAPYQIASVSKQFTAAALLLLEDDGKLDLDDPVSKYLPGVSGGDAIHLRQLLSHTAGLQDYWPQDYSFADMARPVTPQQIVDRWAKKPLDFAPGTQWQYSNTGYVVAGMIVEKVAGEPLLAFLQRRIFKPLAMTGLDQDLAIGKGFPAPYHRNALGPVRPAPPAAHGWLFAAGELAMSASDLAKWDIARMNRAVLPADDWAEQETAVKLADGRDTRYGLGVSLRRTAGGVDYVEHSGEAVGFLSENIVFPKQKAAIVVLVNGDFGDAQETIARGITDMILPPTAAPAPTAANGPRMEDATALYDALVGGTLDRKLLTANCNYYFNAVALDDYRSSLAPLGKPVSFTIEGAPRLRGGFVNRNFALTYANGRKVEIVTYAEPGAAGRWEQFLVMPTQ